MEALDGVVVAAPDVVQFAVLGQIGTTHCFESNEERPQARCRSSLNEVSIQDRLHGSRCLPDTTGAGHSGEEFAGELLVSEKVIVEEVQMATGKAANFGQSVVDGLSVKASPTFEERVAVTEVAWVRAPSRHHDWIRHQVQISFDEVQYLMKTMDFLIGFFPFSFEDWLERWDADEDNRSITVGRYPLGTGKMVWESTEFLL